MRRLCLLLLLVGCSHEAKRENPLDPELTPPVTITASLNDTSGTVAVSWSQYAGQEPFAAYWVLRNVEGSIEVDTLGPILIVGQTTFLDSSLIRDTAYDYRVSAVNAAGFEAASAVVSVQGFTAAAGRLIGVEQDSLAGTLTARWRAYSGPGFDAYRVLRRVAGSDRQDPVAVISVRTDTSFSDATVVADVIYAYVVEVVAVGDTLVSNSQESLLVLPPVEGLVVTANALTATASLSWIPYEGPRFASYRVVRQSGPSGREIRATLSDNETVSYVDSGLIGGTVYSYSIETLTDRGEIVTATAGEVIIHPLVDTWDLEMTSDEVIRLSVEPDGRIAALLSDESDVRLLLYDTQGSLTEELVLQDATGGPGILWDALIPTATSQTTNSVGQRILSLHTQERNWIRSYSAAGHAMWSTKSPFEESDLGSLGSDFGTVVLVALVTESSIPFEQSIVTVDDFEIRHGEEILLTEDFRGNRVNDEALNVSFGSSALFSDEHCQPRTSAERVNALSWKLNMSDASVTTTASLSYSARLSITFSGGGESLQLVIDVPDQSLTVSRARSGQGNIGKQIPFEFIPEVPYRFSLRLEDEAVHVEVQTLIEWVSEEGSQDLTSAMLSVEDKLVVTTEDSRFVLDEMTLAGPSQILPEPVSEMRVWDRPGERRPGFGICLPLSNQVLIDQLSISSLSGDIKWPTPGQTGTIEIGGKLGEGLFLSFDVDLDGRMYILDATNNRILVYDSDGNLITQWGQLGSHAGEFDFGGGASVTDFAGSVVVGPDGFIYVADVGNRRIQKFAP